MDDAVHIKVQVVELLPIGIRSSGVDWNFLAVDLSSLLFDDRAYDFGLNALALQVGIVRMEQTYIFLAKPAKQGYRLTGSVVFRQGQMKVWRTWDTHDGMRWVLSRIGRL
jgi:hypothetical protein